MSRFQRISLIIPTLGESVLRDTVDRLLEAETPVPVEVVVAGQDPERLVADDGRIRFAETPRKYIPAEARNFGARHAEGDLFVFLDSDAFVEPDFFVRILEAMGEDREVVHGAMAFVDDTACNIGDNVATFHAMHESQPPYVMRDAVAAYCLCLTREVFESMQGFNEHIFMAEDWEFANRVRAAGHEIHFDPRVRITHHSDRHQPARLVRHAKSYAIGTVNMLQAGSDLGSRFRVDGLGRVPPLAALWSAAQASLHATRVFLRYPAMRRYLRSAPFVWLFYYARRRHIMRIAAGRAEAGPGGL